MAKRAQKPVSCFWSVDKNNAPESSVGRYHSKNKFWYTCPKKHTFLTLPINVNRGSGCPYCAGKLASDENNLGATHPQLKVEFSQDNAMPFESLTSGSNKEVKWRCVFGHEWETEVCNRTYGYGCPYCSGKYRSPDNNLAIVNPTLAAEYSSKNIKNIHQVSPLSIESVWWTCKNGHHWQDSPRNRHVQQTGCAQCSGRRASSEKNLAIQAPHLLKEFSPKNLFSMESLTASSNKKAIWICASGHEWEAPPYVRVKGHGCLKCFAKTNKLEQKLCSLFNVNKWDQPPSNTDIKNRPDIKLTDTMYINADGLHWHSSLYRDRHYHIDLHKKFKNNNVTLLQFYEDEIINKPDIIKNIVNSKLGNNQKIGARKLQIKSLSTTQANHFLDRNHLIGKINMCRYVGLVTTDNEIRMLLAYKVQKDHVDLTRVCSKEGITVQGGLSRLIVHIRTIHPNLPIRTLTDNRYADGHAFSTVGFVKKNEYLQYQYTDNYVRLDKRHFRVKAGVDEEVEAAKQGFYRIYDAGKVTWELKT